MLGAITGDIIGSPFEGRNYKGDQFKSKEFELFTPMYEKEDNGITLRMDGSHFTDDTICTCAVAEAIMNPGIVPDGVNPYAWWMRKIGCEYPNRGWGALFREWVMAPTVYAPFGSWANGAAMRVSPVAWAFRCYLVDKVLDEPNISDHARWSAQCTHNSPEGMRGAEAVASAVFMAKNGETKDGICRNIAYDYYPGKRRIGENTGECIFPVEKGALDHIRKDYQFWTSAERTVPVAIMAFLDSNNFEDAIRNAVSLGGDADTLACIAGAIAEAFYGGVPEQIVKETVARLDDRLYDIVKRFNEKIMKSKYNLGDRE